MKAIAFTKYGSPDFLEQKEIERPTSKDDEVLIKVHAASINSWDWELLHATPFVNRLMFGLFRPMKITALGCDIAGRVESVSKDVTGLVPGDEVFCDISGGSWGGFAEYACAREEVVVKKIPGMTFEQAAAIPQAGVLALQGLNYKGKVQPGQAVLINGGGGGVGTFAIQMAKSFGAEVTGVDSTEKLDTMHAAGADHVLDYTKEDYTKTGKQYDKILDMVSNRSLLQYKQALAPRGTYAIVGGANPRILQALVLGPWIARTEKKKMGLLLHKPNKKDLETIQNLFKKGEVIPIIDKQYPLHEVPQALKYFGEGHVKGKAVITVKEAEQNS